jgi:hypothetical protein
MVGAPGPCKAQNEICDLSGGTVNSNADCSVSCLPQIAASLTARPLRCYAIRFVRTAGTASCQSGTTGTACMGTISVVDMSLGLTWFCNSAGACQCDGAIWNNETVAACLGTTATYAHTRIRR